MAKSIAIRQTSNSNIPVRTDEPGLAVVPKTLWSPCLGLDYLNRANRVGPNHATQMLNLWLDRGVARSRYGTAQVGLAADDPVMGVVNFVAGSGIGFLVRFTTTKLQVWDGAVWSDVGSATYTGGTSDYFAYTVFNDSLIFSNGVDGLWDYNPTLGSLTQIDADINARQLTTLGGRVLASGIPGAESTLMWSVKNNSHDWTGIGSGDEPLLSTPGGQVDQLMGVWPISASVAIMIRTNSVWQVTESGDPDAPFRFERLYDNLGSRSRYSVDVVPGGVVFLGTDDIYVISDKQVESIGQLVKDTIFGEVADLTTVRGVFRPKTADYWLANADTVYRYSFPAKGWSRSKYTFNVRWMDESVYHLGGKTWADATGTWDDATGTWEDSRGTAQAAAFYFATDEATGNVIKEDPSSTADGYVQTGKSAQGIEIRTGVLLAGTPLEKTEIIEAQLEYEDASARVLTFAYSTDLGANWVTYSTKTTKVTTRQEIMRVMKTLSRQSIMLRITAAGLGSLVLVSFSPFLVTEAKVAP